jgi:hypothetical protein
MCQDETTVVSRTVRTGVALTSGALFGMAAQAVLRYAGLDRAAIHGDLIVGAAARPGFAAWVWWFLAIAVFFVGPLGLILVKRFIADRWLFRGWRLLPWVVLVLGLVTLVHLAPSSLGLARAPQGFPVVVLSALLAAIGARLAWPAGRSSGPQAGRDRASGPFPISRSAEGGSVNSGLPMRRVPRVRSILSGVRGVTNVALAVLVPIAALATVSALSGAVVVRELAAPGVLRAPVAKQAIRQAPRIEVLALADEPAGADPRAAVAAIRAEPVRAAPTPVPKPAVRMTAVAKTRVPMSASELTFAKGYAKRRAALQAAKTDQAAAPEIKTPAKMGSRTAALAERYDRSHRRSAHARHGGYQRVAAYHRHAGSDRHAGASGRYTDGFNRYAGHGRQRSHDRSGGYERYAHYDDWRW